MEEIGNLLPYKHHKNFMDLRGFRFGKLTVFSETQRLPSNTVRWTCICECGKNTKATSSNLKCGKVQSCGCATSELITKSKVRHGCSFKGKWTGAYKSWARMMSRCFQKSNNRRSRYMDRGITVCERWKKFINFYEDMGERPDGHSIERIDNDKSYTCGKCDQCNIGGWEKNCIWILRKFQTRNTGQNRVIEFDGISMCASEWAEKYKIPTPTFFYRLYANWDFEKILKTPVRKGNYH